MFLVNFQMTQQLLTMTYGAAVTDPQPCAFALPWLFVGRAPPFAYCKIEYKRFIDCYCIAKPIILQSDLTFGIRLRPQGGGGDTLLC